MRVNRIYLDRNFAGNIGGVGGESLRLGDVYRLQSVTIEGGTSRNEVHVGMPDTDVIAAIGHPSQIQSNGLWYRYDSHDVSFLLDQNKRVERIYLGSNFKGVIRGTTGGSVHQQSVFSSFGGPTSKERLAYSPSPDTRIRATDEVEKKFKPIDDSEDVYPLEYRGNRKLYELYGKGMVLKYKYVIDPEGIAFYMDHNRELYSTVLYPPYPLPGQPQIQKRAPKKDDVVCLEIIHFDFDKYNIKNMYIPVLDKWIAYINQNPDTYVVIEGHTDAKGTTGYNQGLSQRRSRSVYNYFTRMGIPASRLRRVGYSENQPIAPNMTSAGRDDPEGRAVNRRVQFKVIKPSS
ncbi:MAG: OmpA family protein [Deltaproteobacteria bacterium]|nr:OmpA family protein [Deltaproteobacteria bacterium]